MKKKFSGAGVVVLPNVAHKALADFEKRHDGRFLIVTQNVDDLHERTGSKNIIHMHGELRKARCLDTGKIYDWDQDLDEKGRLRPHIYWFGEIPFQMDEIGQALEEADLFIAVGTSGFVYPAAGFVNVVGSSCRKVLLNKDEAQNNPLFDEVHLGPASITVPEFFHS